MATTLVLPLAASLPARAADPAFCTVPDGLVANTYVGPSQVGDVGTWDNAGNWSLGHAPNNANSASEILCIGGSGTVDMPDLAGIEVQAAALDLGPNARLVVGEGNKLLLNGTPSVVESRIRPGGRLQLTAGTFGGTGRILLAGSLSWTSRGAGKAATITTRTCSNTASCASQPFRRGLLRILPTGVLDVDSAVLADGVNLFDNYRIEVAGVFRLTGPGGYVAADHGTSLRIEAATTTSPAGRFELRNNGGWYEGRDPFALPLSRIENLGQLVKLNSNGNSVIEAGFPSGNQGPVTVASGVMALPEVAVKPVQVNAGKTYGTGRCATSTYACKAEPVGSDTHTNEVVVPASDGNGAKVSVTEVPRTITGFGQEVVVEATGLVATRTSPAVLRLRYDNSIRGSHYGANTQIWHKHGTGSFSLVPTCTSTGAIPASAVACVDRRPGQSRVLGAAEGYDLLMIVRTIQFSRWVGR